MNALRLMPLVMMLAACSSVNLPLSPHRIDVQQGNALEQEAVDKLKPGMSRAQVRFLLGTPLLVDPFHSNRWDYVYNYRAKGKPTERKRLTLIFDGDKLVSIQAEGLAPGTVAAAQPPATSAQKDAAVSEQSLAATSIVPPLGAAARPEVTVPATPPSERPPEPVVLQSESNVAAIQPDVMPPPTTVAPSSADGHEAPVLAAMEAWARAWKTRDEDAYIAAYARSFRPQGGLSRAEWEKRRRVLLGISRNIDVRVDSPAVTWQGDKRATVTFNQFYSSDRYQDAVVKQLTFVRVDGNWLIEEEKVLGPFRVKK